MDAIAFQRDAIFTQTDDWQPRNGGSDDFWRTVSRWVVCLSAQQEQTKFSDLAELERQRVARSFKQLAAEWRRSRNPLSSLADDDLRSEPYRRITGLGEPAIRLILEELNRELKESEPDQWFEALWGITGEDPVPEESRGDIKAMAKAWLTWGVAQGYIDAETVGARIS